MKKKLKSILLVDDDDNCNFFHRRLLLKMDCVEQVHVTLNGKEAITFLKSTIDGNHPCPDIIFLDINMPQMDGWEFLNEYKNLDDKARAQIILIMLSTSLNPDDRDRALSIEDVTGFQNKYLKQEAIKEILENNFPNHF